MAAECRRADRRHHRSRTRAPTRWLVRRSRSPASRPTIREALLVGLSGPIASLLFRGFEGGRWSDIPIFNRSSIRAST